MKLKLYNIVEFLCSSIGKKLIMSLSGFFLLCFLVVHLSLNLTALYSRELYETTCEFMDKTTVVQFLVPVLAGGFIVHILCCLFIELQNWRARPVGYAVGSRGKAASWASKNMFALGLIVLGFLVIHFFHFWSKMQLLSFMGHEPENAYDLLITFFSKGYNCLFYIVWLVAVYFHISHGFWSAFQTLGVSNSTWLPRLKVLAQLYAVPVILAFMVIPLYFYLGYGEPKTAAESHVVLNVQE